MSMLLTFAEVTWSNGVHRTLGTVCFSRVLMAARIPQRPMITGSWTTDILITPSRMNFSVSA